MEAMQLIEIVTQKQISKLLLTFKMNKPLTIMNFDATLLIIVVVLSYLFITKGYYH